MVWLLAHQIQGKSRDNPSPCARAWGSPNHPSHAGCQGSVVGRHTLFRPQNHPSSSQSWDDSEGVEGWVCLSTSSVCLLPWVWEHVSPCACVGLCARVGAPGAHDAPLSMHDACGSKSCRAVSHPSTATTLLVAPNHHHSCWYYCQGLLAGLSASVPGPLESTNLDRVTPLFKTFY